MQRRAQTAKLPKRRESDILSSCLRYLKARGIFAMRMNVGSFAGEYKGRKRFVKFGIEGCADILAIEDMAEDGFYPHWIECKTLGGKQSPAQLQFAQMVNDLGHGYCIVHSAEELSLVL